MLTEQEIKTLCDQGRIVKVPSLDWRAPTERFVYASPEMYRFLTASSSDSTVEQDRSRLHRLMDRFTSGRGISVALKRHINGSNLKRLSPGTEEVWEFKITSQPQFRVFGRFARPDNFIVLTGPVDRQGCDYDAEKLRCQAEWNNLGQGFTPLYGSRANDYITTNVIPLGDPRRSANTRR